MNDEQIKHHLQAIRRQLAALHAEDVRAWEEIDAVLEDLHVMYEQMQTCLEAAEILGEELLQKKQHYYDLFQFSPIAYLFTDANGVILEANQAISQLLDVPHSYLVGKTLAMFVAEHDRFAFQTYLGWLPQSTDTETWQVVKFCPRKGEPVAVELRTTTVRNADGLIESLRIGVYDVGKSHREIPLEQHETLNCSCCWATNPK